jgi:hypothetical protein
VSVEEGIVAIVTGDPQCRRQLAGRVFPGAAKQDTDGPYLCYHAQGEDDGYFLAGNDGVPKWRGMLEVWDTDPDRCYAAARAVKDALVNFRRGWSGDTFLQSVRASHAGTDEEEDAGVTGRWWYRRRVEVAVDYEQQPAPRGPARGEP